MKQNVSPIAALFVAAIVSLGFAGVSPVHAADAKAQNSKVAGPVLKAAKTALDAKKYQEAIAKAKEAQGLSGKNAYDDHLANEMLYFAYARTQQYADAARVLEATLDSEYLPKSEQPKRLRSLLQLSYQLKNFDKVISLGERAVKEGFADDEIYTWVGQAYYLKGDYKGAAKFVEGYVASQQKAGKKPKEQTLLLVQSACDKSGDSACRQRVLESLVANYPKSQYWSLLMDAMTRNQSDQSEKVQLQVYRLAVAVDVPLKSKDYTEFAQLALEAGSPGEAQAILEKGFTKKVFTEKRDVERNTRLLENAKKQAATDQSSLEKAARDAASGTSGDKDVSVGLAYLGYQQYDKAVEAINRGLGKPGLQNAAEARLLLGIAELNAGRKDEARKTFKQVKGDPTLERLANLWSLHSQA
jgi:TolA-binding protein